MYKFLVVDFDGTFQPEDENDVDCAPAVYAVEDVKRAAEVIMNAKLDWEDSDGDDTLQESIEFAMKESAISFIYIGLVSIPYKDRSSEYLAGVKVVYV